MSKQLMVCLVLVAVLGDQFMQIECGDGRALAGKVKGTMTQGLSNAVEPAENDIVGIVKCAVDVMDGIASEFNCGQIWHDIQGQSVKNVNNLFLCLKSTGFTLKKCIAKEAVGIGLNAFSFLKKLDSESPEAAKQLRIRIVDRCANSQ
ncbi:uncharacterized protein LOC129575123 [Sitodiplosis mosellana]|uniref:uncharacterized protein LOC129575123 n=1 Tax=Sitodiplosis mosellana TaxID=263140 RepID=UPI0024442127|nr:uncharacterized protein LOC129575123 [Sitodiplosis mosellana]